MWAVGALPAAAAAAPQPHDELLVFSFEAAGSTQALGLSGNSFAPVEVPGLHDGSASLLVAAAPGGWLVQVTRSSVRVVGPPPGRQLAHVWEAAAGAQGRMVAARMMVHWRCQQPEP